MQLVAVPRMILVNGAMRKHICTKDPSGMLARIPFGLTTGPIEGAEILVAGCRKETVASEMRSNVLKYRDTLFIAMSNLPRLSIVFCDSVAGYGKDPRW